MREPAVVEARRLARSLPLPVPFSVRELILKLERDRCRRIIIHAVEPGWAGTSAWCGAWLEAPDADHIVYVRDSTSTVRNASTILHEVGHILLDHAGAGLPAGVARIGVELTGVARARGRATFDDPEERAAETFSSLILQRAMAVSTAADKDSRVALLKSRLG